MRSKKHQDTTTDHSIQRKNIHGSFDEEEYYDMISVVLIRLGGDPDNYEPGSLQYLLMVLFSDKVPAWQKKEILEKQYSIPMRKDLGEEIDTMCNLSEGIERRGIEIGVKKGVKIGEKKGVKQGIKQERKRNQEKLTVNVKNARAAGIPDDIIAICNGLDPATIREM